MSILTSLQDEMKVAMKGRNQARLDALRLIISAIRYVELDLPAQAGTPKTLSDEQIVGVLTKEAKKRREAIEAYKAVGRSEQMEKEQYELALIETYLPKMMSEDEVRAKVTEAFGSAKPDSFGEAMGVAMKAVGGQSEGSMVARIVKEFFKTK